MNRRSFIKGLIALASAPAIGKYVNVFKTEGARKGIENVASQGVDFFNSVIKKVMDEGNLINESDRIQTFKHPDRPDINVEVDLGSGSSSVYFDTDQGTKAGAELVKDIEVGPGYTELLENEEVYKTGAGGEVYKDVDEQITGGITNLEKFLKGKKGFAAGGRVGMFRGGIPKGLQAAMRAIMSKYGDDAITTADKAPQPAKTTQEQIMDFNARNPNPNRQMTDEEVTEFADEFGLDPSEEYYSWDGTLTDARRILKEDEDYKASMFKEYKAGRLDPEAGSVSQARLSFLRQKEQLAADMGNEYKYRLTEDEIAELDYLEDYFRKDYLDFKAQQTDRKMTQEEIEELKELGEKGFKDGGDVSLTVIKIPDISESGVESLFKRR
jgi:hypothetical protein